MEDLKYWNAVLKNHGLTVDRGSSKLADRQAYVDSVSPTHKEQINNFYNEVENNLKEV